MPMSAQEIYAQSVRPLPPAERLRLAALILNESGSPGSVPAATLSPSISAEEEPFGTGGLTPRRAGPAHLPDDADTEPFVVFSAPSCVYSCVEGSHGEAEAAC